MVKHCRWNNCHSRSPPSKLEFYCFPRPCKYFRCELKDSSIKVKHELDSCFSCSKALAWMKACKSKGFENLEQLTKKTTFYLCSLHFVDGKPTQEHPTPTFTDKQSEVSNGFKDEFDTTMPSSRDDTDETATKSIKENDQITVNGPSEVIDVSDTEAAEPEEIVVNNNAATSEPGGTLDFTENVEDGSNSDSIPMCNPEKENGSGEGKMDEDEVNEVDHSKTKDNITSGSKDDEMREPDIEINQDHKVDGKSDDEDNSDDNGMSIAVTRSKRSSVRRPVRHGDFDFDYADSSEYEEGSDAEDEDGNSVTETTRSRELRSLRMDRQRGSRGLSVTDTTTEDGENEEEVAPTRGRLDRSRKNRKRSSNTDNQSGMKRRRKNQPVQIEDLDDETPTSNGLDDVHLNSSQDADMNQTENNVDESSDGVRTRGGEVEALSEVDSNADGGQRVEREAPSDQSPSGDDSDLFCWVCHKYGKVICCETCVRVYHMRCLNLNAEPSDDWFCPECADIVVDAQRSSGLLDPTGEDDSCSQARLPISKRELAPLLLHAIEMMRLVPSSEPFHEPVDTNDVKDYDSYIVNPMSLNKLEENVHAMKYSSTGGFMSDARWILHNCIVYNGANNPLTSISRQILKRCRIEMREIVACPDCYKFQMEANNGNASNDESEHWFSQICRIPHPIVWVRLRNYPVWPAKVIEEVLVKDEFRVRTKFFGAHDYAEVPFSCATFHTRARSTSTDTRNHHVEHYKLALDELQEHERLLRQRYPDFVLPNSALKYIPEIANNAYRLLGSRQKRLVSATIRGEGSMVSNSSNSSDNGHGPSGGLIGSRRSSNDSVGSSVFAGGNSVHVYRAKPISDMKTRLVSVPISTPNSNATEDVSSTAGEQGEDVPTQPEESTDIEPIKKNGKDLPPLTVVEEEMENESSKSISNQSVTAQANRATDRHPPESCNGADIDEENDRLMDVDDSIAPPAVQRDHVSTEDKSTYTEDVGDIMDSLCAADSSSSDQDVLSMSTRELLSCIRWACQGGTRVGSVAKAREETEKVAVDSQELSKLRRENGHLRQCVSVLEEQLDLVKNKCTREMKMTEDRLATFYELKLLEQRHNFDLSVAETRHSYDNDRAKVINETRRLLLEDVKKIVAEVKGKQWCAYCRNEAFYYCCWNTSYCDANCQKKHWTTHMGSCAQTNQQNADAGRGQMARAPNSQQAAINAQHANQTNMAAQMIPGRRMMTSMPQINQR